MIPNMLEYYNMVLDNNISIIYNGPIWADCVESIGNTLKKRLEIDEPSLTITQSVFSVFIEQMYNILNYSADRALFHSESSGTEFPFANGVFILGEKDKQYFIQCGNRIRDEHIDFIRDRIDYLNTLDRAGLRKFYKECLRKENDNPESKGAGLGLIEIARRSSSKMEYEFVPVKDGYSFFTLYVTIG